MTIQIAGENPVSSNQVYAALSQRYDAKNGSPAGVVERASVLSALGDLTGKSVLDIGCGTGFYARVFHGRGAAKVVAGDLSEEMIGIARGLEEVQKAGIRYHVLDATALPDLGTFDVVTAIWMINHINDPAALSAFIDGFSRLTAPGGTALLLTTNRDGDWDLFGDGFRRYGYTMAFNRPETDGNRPYMIQFNSGGESFGFQSTSWSPAVLEKEFVRAGFRTIQRARTVLPGADYPWLEGDNTTRDADFYEELLRSPSYMIFRLTK